MIEDVLAELFQLVALAAGVRLQITDYFAKVVFFEVVFVLAIRLNDSILIQYALELVDVHAILVCRSVFL